MLLRQQFARLLGVFVLDNAALTAFPTILALLGLTGGLIGVGIGLMALIGATGASGSALPIGSAFLLMLVCVIVALVAAISTAWGASGEKPLNVLRYE